MKRLKHFYWALRKSWAVLILLIGLVILLLFLCQEITDNSPDTIKNIFSILVSLLCGIMVSLATFAIHLYTTSLYAYNQIEELVTNTCQSLLVTYENTAETPSKELAQKYGEVFIIYREICFLSEALTYKKDFIKVSCKFRKMVELLKGIRNSDHANQDLEKAIKLIQEMAQGNYVCENTNTRNSKER